MTTLAADAGRVTEIGDIQEYPVIAADIVYRHAAVGLVDATGNARPLTSVDRFVGFAESRCDNAAGAAAAKNVRVVARGKVQLTISGVEKQDVVAQSPVYASDDDTFSLNPADGQFVGFVSRYVTTDTAIVAFDAERVETRDARAAQALRERAARLYMRAQGHAMAALELAQPGFAKALSSERPVVWPRLAPQQVGLAYWAAASWAGFISLSKDHPEVVADLPLVVRLARLGRGRRQA